MNIKIFLLCVLTMIQSSHSNTVPIESRIINGNPALPDQFPWQAALFIYEQEPNITFCSGSIITNRWILTAAHCLNNAKSVMVYTGVTDISQIIIGLKTSNNNDFIIHEDYNPGTLANDIALIRLAQNLTFTASVTPIPLSFDQVEVGTTITISGWGKTRGDDQTISSHLNYVNLKTISNEDCQQAYGDSGNVLPEMMCAGTGPDLLQTPCHGDSGGPVVVDFGTNPRQVAIASFVSSFGCESGYPSGYTRIAYYQDWIRKKTGI